ncbi:helix-turn-helix domain-containing protein [Streptomyces sp. NPDC101234]|uniref:helix-turn-helix domain-containing protein n=1 Tax=Streptomyces sp. NPDC101234 TaxID=3366138 RepID=UPI0037FDF14A
MLRQHRRTARLPLEQLAEASGVSARTLSDIERGRSKGPQHRTVTAVADALSLSYGSWSCWTTPRPRSRYAPCCRPGARPGCW